MPKYGSTRQARRHMAKGKPAKSSPSKGGAQQGAPGNQGPILMDGLKPARKLRSKGY